ncbi:MULTISPECIES: gephyrin-like molybdotransferase Glp [Methylomonas]|uniref:Molybdopterin molybdenumtransferase n=2 Tax=Methylomonas TaxID=416 RepID=A0A126T381_9GAMM|nr:MULTISPECIES: gephyrin-like molybdotransferase Glp [Methylomonas]AMK76530.1 molybdopterin molybdenumtransferase [Methylomonas denitrificans]OAH98787.1 molybdopterin molybdenumtransferase MoeA [Methylomonas methanica]TCV88565.1 molybdopterin molybdotransferase [Methylomonas methanica]
MRNLTNNDTLQLNRPSCVDEYDPTTITVDVARQFILDYIKPLASTDWERIPLRHSMDRVLAEDIIAEMNVPPYDNSAMDGFALHAIDIPQNGTTTLKIVGDSLAGHPFLEECSSGECIRIMTGAMIPAGCNTIIPQEHVELLGAESIKIDGRSRLGDNVRSAGEDIRLGQTVLTCGRRLTAADLGLLSSLGVNNVAVIRRLRVAFFSTGDELQATGEPLQPGQIYDSNRYTLFGMLSRQHCDITDLGVVGDDPVHLYNTLELAAKNHDVIISSGGVSVGAADYIHQVMSELGEIVFWKVAMKPGRPLIFGRLQKALFFGLPGNPVAVMVSFNQFVQPALQRFGGEILHPPLILRAQTRSLLKKRAGRTEYQRGILSQTPDGVSTVCKTGDQGSGILFSMSQANCFIVLTADQTRVEIGSTVIVQPFATWL